MDYSENRTIILAGRQSEFVFLFSDIGMDFEKMKYKLALISVTIKDSDKKFGTDETLFITCDGIDHASYKSKTGDVGMNKGRIIHCFSADLQGKTVRERLNIPIYYAIKESDNKIVVCLTDVEGQPLKNPRDVIIQLNVCGEG